MQDTSHPQERARWRAGSSATILTGPLLIFGPAMSGSLPIIVIANAIDDKGIQTLIKGGATMPGWMSDTVGATNFDELPEKAQNYVRFLSDQIGTEIGLISTGPERDQTIILKESVMEGWFR